MMIGYMVIQLAIIGCKWASPISSRTLFPRMGKYSADEPNKQKTKLTEASHKPYSMGSVFFMSIVIGLLAGLVSLGAVMTAVLVTVVPTGNVSETKAVR